MTVRSSGDDKIEHLFHLFHKRGTDGGGGTDDDVGNGAQRRINDDYNVDDDITLCCCCSTSSSYSFFSFSVSVILTSFIRASYRIESGLEQR